VISTRVGYTGGDVLNAIYRNHGTHAEAIEIVFDPRIISYGHRSRHQDAIRLFGLLGGCGSILAGVLGA